MHVTIMTRVWMTEGAYDANCRKSAVILTLFQVFSSEHGCVCMSLVSWLPPLRGLGVALRARCLPNCSGGRGVSLSGELWPSCGRLFFSAGSRLWPCCGTNPGFGGLSTGSRFRYVTASGRDLAPFPQQFGGSMRPSSSVGSHMCPARCPNVGSG